LRGYTIRATDGDIGKVYEFYLDDDAWTIRYLLVDIGSWLSGRLAIIPRAALGQADSKCHILPVELTKKQVESSPGIDANKPVYRQQKSRLPDDWPIYWGGGRLLIAGAFDGYPYTKTKGGKRLIEEHKGDPHLRSTREVIGYRIQAIDGEIGHVDNFIVDDETWVIHYIVVDTRNWLPGRKVLVPTHWIEDIRWPEYKIRIDLLRESIRNLPQEGR
jgi:sporulation protein YlmC with PRC-barrel domain